MKFRTILEGTVVTLLVSFVLYGQNPVRWQNLGRQTEMMTQYGYKAQDLNLGGGGYPN